ncbi:vesicle-associated membrane protein 1 isoform X1 [Lepeophtheirus salmonis]|uniref:vesicle-associated membrane protein 1 isoform X1 n=1 Tax=Lepeophtheirus salmonis TaxID=72036 RepID=UPI001AE2944C|nr:vesicle-associated membrane protein 2-like isoform X1 [Lepeophtheirus salmonis]XP_040583503.1 vesicle-associated membrane protein 2-like isoform X1 [Lepeophtheirus salmonis]
MADTEKKEDKKPDRPLGPDGKPIPGPEQMRQIQAARKMGQQQAQVDEVINIMHTNVEQVLERDSKLGALEERADALQDGCAQFEKQAAAMKNKFWLENLKSMIAMGVVGVILLGLLYWKFFASPPPPQYPPPYGYPPPPPPPPPPSVAPGPTESPAGDTGSSGDNSGADSLT